MDVNVGCKPSFSDPVGLDPVGKCVSDEFPGDAAAVGTTL